MNDFQGTARPGVPCARGEEDANCNPLLHKSILIISDGASFPGDQLRSRLGEAFGGNDNPAWIDSPICEAFSASDLPSYHAAATAGGETGFDNHFTTYLSGGHFGGAGMDLVLDAFQIMDRWTSDTPARRNLRSAALANLSPWQLFRGLDADATDALMNEANELGFDSRPVQVEHFLPAFVDVRPVRPNRRPGFVGDTDTLPLMPLAPVADAAPFNVAGLPTAVLGDGTPGSGSFGEGDLFAEMANRLDGWFVEACRIAGERQVRVNAIFIGDAQQDANNIAVLESCVDAASGTPGHQDVFVTPDAEALDDAFTALFTVRRNLRFLN